LYEFVGTNAMIKDKITENATLKRAKTRKIPGKLGIVRSNRGRETAPERVLKAVSGCRLLHERPPVGVVCGVIPCGH
jgi:hypothetical protein